MTLETDDEFTQVWDSGTYSEFARRYLPMAGQLVEAVGVDSANHVLDIGCGTGNVAITAARHGVAVTGMDIAPSMLEQARTNAEIAAVGNIEWQEGNATDLPFEADAFDVVMSNLGHMYGDPPERTTNEILRVTRPDGRVGFTSWTPTSVFPLIAGLVLTYVPRRHHPEFSEPPFMWGDPDVVERRLDDQVDTLEFDTETLQYHTLSPSHFWQELSDNSGMLSTLLEEVHDRSALREEAIETIEPHFDSGSNAVELEYLLTTASTSGSVPPQ